MAAEFNIYLFPPWAKRKFHYWREFSVYNLHLFFIVLLFKKKHVVLVIFLQRRHLQVTLSKLPLLLLGVQRENWERAEFSSHKLAKIVLRGLVL